MILVPEDWASPLSWLASSHPSTSGSPRSRNTMLGRNARATCSATRPEMAKSTSWPSPRTSRAIDSAVSMLSSTTSTRISGSLPLVNACGAKIAVHPPSCLSEKVRSSGRRRARLGPAGRLERVEIDDQPNEDDPGQRGTQRKPKHIGKSVSGCRSAGSDQCNGGPVGDRVEQSSRLAEPPKRCRDQGAEHAGC